ncbi:MAG: PocR ligand-binding domain-containing protein [Deltaproteobacteria bacterium]|nr:PocR ligand-binding domain-containing protein [Deltaproteobacteria bacterium]
MSIDLMQSAGIEDLASADDLETLCTSFGSLLGVGIRIVDAEGRGLASHRLLADACEYLHGFPSMTGECESFFQRILKPDGDADGHVVHHCYAGLAYATMPLHYDGDLLGNIVLGPFRPSRGSGAAGQAELTSGVDRAKLETLVERTRSISAEGLGRIFSAVVTLLLVILRMGHKVMATGLAHTLSVEESYRQLLEKNKELEDHQRRLEEVDRLKSNLLATMSHELRTPLTSIIGYSDMLASGMGGGELTEDQLGYVSTIAEKGEGLLGTISTILDVASLESGRFEVERQRTPITEIVESAVHKVKEASPRRDVKLELGELSSAVVVVDPEMVGKAIYQLIDNAMKFSKPGGHVQVQVRELSQRPKGDEAVGYVVMAPKLNWVEIMVCDYGVGMPQEIQKKIFEPLFQGDDSVTRRHGGLGLGLALVKHYVAANEGRVRVESTEGEGSTFYIRFPREEEPERPSRG